jgi:hypothetical protein
MNRDFIEAIHDDKLAIQDSRQTDFPLKRIDKEPIKVLGILLVHMLMTNPSLKQTYFPMLELKAG